MKIDVLPRNCAIMNWDSGMKLARSKDQPDIIFFKAAAVIRSFYFADNYSRIRLGDPQKSMEEN